MIKNLLKIAIRHIRKHPGYSLLNVLGLTLGISSALFLIIYVSDEVSYDRYHENADRIHLYSTNPGEPEPTGSITYVIIFGIVALFLILIAAMNYMNLATASSANRAREVGLRKVVGSRRGPLVAQFLSERFKRQFEDDEKRGLIFTMFTILAIIIACLGLFGLASYMVEQRTKEIGIRKVFGANEGVVVRLISKDFLILVAISIIIALPVAYYFMSNWLENYVYRTKIGLPLLFIAAILTIVITFVTISFKSYQAAAMNPASSLRTE
jgi:ABC-type antimicrobial peptide transport system permease subunit